MSRPVHRLTVILTILAAFCLMSCSDDPATPSGPPPAVADLSVMLTEVGALTMTWTVPNPASGQGSVTGFDLRYSTDSTTDWSGWTPVTTPEAPAVGERVTLRIDGLAQGATYHLRIRTRAADGQLSSLSARVAGTTEIGTPSAPPVVDDLAVIEVEADALTVSWTVPSAEGTEVDVSSYDLRHTTDPTAPWDDWTQAPAPLPAAVGTRDTVRIAGLTTDVDQVIRLRTGSADGLWSNLSGAVYGTPVAVPGRVYRVAQDGSGDFHKLQSAVDAARPGDTILVAPGLYTWTNMVTPSDQFAVNHGMVYIRRDLTDVVIRSEAGPHRTTLDGQGLGRLFFVQGYNTGCVIDGFTIINGRANSFDAYAGGGIVGHLSSPTIRNCVFRDNMAIGANDSIGQGGAIWWGGVSEVKIRGCVFEDNEAEIGGALLLVNSYDTDVVQDCVFTGNVARNFGGAIAVYNAMVRIERCVMAENVGVESGGAVWINGSDPGSDPDTVILDHCTMVGNDAPDGAVRLRDIHDGRILNTIIAHGLDGRTLSWNFEGALTLTCNDLYGYPDGNAPPVGFTDGGGNLLIDPMFCGWAQGGGAVGLQLDPASPCATAACGPIGALAVGCQR